MTWSPDQPLRADATDEQICQRKWNLARLGVADSSAVAAREFATASVEAALNPIVKAGAVELDYSSAAHQRESGAAGQRDTQERDVMRKTWDAGFAFAVKEMRNTLDNLGLLAVGPREESFESPDLSAGAAPLLADPSGENH